MRYRSLMMAATVAGVAGLAQAQSFTEAFDDIVTLSTSGGWFQQNNSAPIGLTNYFQGNLTVFPSQASAGYLGTNFNNTAGTATISNWFVTPVVNLQNGQTFSFFTRTVDAPFFPDRLQVRMSLAGASTNVGALGNATAVGDFTTLLLDINPTYLVTGTGSFPNVYTQFTVTISGAPASTPGRLAFRYFVENGGPTGANSDYIGIDTAEYVGGGGGGGGCYANCDLSTVVPFLNVNDFVCFNNKFATGDTGANCDQSTVAPVLNVNDFICFNNAFASGCSAP
ncbi:MAG: choice-of-anchor J domain-containing protein [Phycisphaerales bacterium]